VSFLSEVYGIPPSRWSPPAGAGAFNMAPKGGPHQGAELPAHDDNAGKPGGINLVIGRRPYLAFGNSTATDRCSNIRKAGGGVSLAMLCLAADDGTRNTEYGPAKDCPKQKSARFHRSLRRATRRLDRVSA